MITPKQYAQAFIEAKSAVSVERLVQLIRKNGDWSRRTKIVHAIEDAWRTKLGKSLVVIASARPLTEKQRALFVEKFPEQKFDVMYRVDPELIAGVRIEIDHEHQIDSSLQMITKKMFNK